MNNQDGLLEDMRIKALRAKLAHNPDMHPADVEEILSLLSQMTTNNDLYRLQVADREAYIKKLTSQRDDYCQRVMDIESAPGLWERLDLIREMAAPFRYALQQLADKDWHDDYTVFVDGALWDETGLSITAKHFYKLMNAIYDNFPEVKIPPDSDDPTA